MSFKHPSPADLARWRNAQSDLLKGRADRALAAYQELLKRLPDTGELWFELGLAAAKELDFALADQAFQQAAERARGDLAMLDLIGQQYQLLRRPERARVYFEAAVASAPASIPAQLALTQWYEREGRLEAAWNIIATCASQHPYAPQVRCVQAWLEHRRGNHAAAEQLLRALLPEAAADPHTLYACRQQLAVVLDALGQPAEALHWLHEAKTVLRSTANVARLEQLYDAADRRRRQLLAGLTPAHLRRWRAAPATETNLPALAFLGGHPRSGTTLLEQVLGAHPGLTALDEPPAFTQEILEPLAPLENAAALTIGALDELNARRRARFQLRYLKNLARENAARTATGILLDKNPSHTASIHLWLRLFPAVKILIALRDPRDVIISCYFQNLQLNATNANFLSLDRTAKHYADLMDVWLRLRELGGFDWLESRYEDLVANPEKEGRRATHFLGLDWHPQQAQHHAAAREKFLFAPTYREATQPVHQRAVNRWQNYSAALALLQPRLAAYCRAFGYG